MDEWISIKDRLPRENEYKGKHGLNQLIVYTHGDSVASTAEFNGCRWFQWANDGPHEIHVSYWMPFPEPPKE